MDVDKRALRRPNGPLGINTARPHIYRIRAELQSTLISSAATTTITPVNLTTNLTDDKDNTNNSCHSGSVFATQVEMVASMQKFHVNRRQYHPTLSVQKT